MSGQGKSGVSLFSDKIAVERECVERVVLKAASVLKARLDNALRSGKPVVFLGGDCSDGNRWREQVKSEFEGVLAFVDPYDEDWDPKDNIYDELAALVRADHVVFYNGGKGAEKEKSFLEMAGMTNGNRYKEFDDMNSLRRYLRRLSTVGREVQE